MRRLGLHEKEFVARTVRNAIFDPKFKWPPDLDASLAKNFYPLTKLARQIVEIAHEKESR